MKQNQLLEKENLDLKSENIELMKEAESSQVPSAQKHQMIEGNIYIRLLEISNMDPRNYSR